MAYLVRCKGLGDETSVKRVTRSVDELGYRKVVIKTHGEPALIAVQEAIAANRVQKTLVENPRHTTLRQTVVPREPCRRSRLSCGP